MTESLAGRVAVVTGATGGVGGAIAAALLGAGAAVALVGRSETTLRARAADAGWDASRVTLCPADLSIAEDVARLADHLMARLPSIDILVHAAAEIRMGHLETSPLADLDHQFGINVRAVYQLTQALLMPLKQSRGQIVFVNSSAGVTARAGVTQYAATKHALRAVADGLREEVNPDGVRVMSVYLGRTASRMQAAVHQHEGRPYSPERLLQPESVATMVLAALQLPRTAEVTDLYMRPMLKP